MCTPSKCLLQLERLWSMKCLGSNPPSSRSFRGYSDSASNLTALISVFSFIYNIIVDYAFVN